jgi:hypothetical protein
MSDPTPASPLNADAFFAQIETVYSPEVGAIQDGDAALMLPKNDNTGAGANIYNWFTTLDVELQLNDGVFNAGATRDAQYELRIIAERTIPGSVGPQYEQVVGTVDWRCKTGASPFRYASGSVDLRLGVGVWRIAAMLCCSQTAASIYVSDGGTPPNQQWQALSLGGTYQAGKGTTEVGFMSLKASRPFGRYILGNTVPYTAVTYKPHGGVTQYLADPGATYTQYFGALDDSVENDPTASIIPMWGQLVSNFGTRLNEIILQIAAFCASQNPAINISDKYKKVTGGSFTFSQFVPVEQWPIYSATSPWQYGGAPLSVQQKQQMLRLLALDLRQYGNGIVNNSLISDFFGQLISAT